jgi:hypothetical protein
LRKWLLVESGGEGRWNGREYVARAIRDYEKFGKKVRRTREAERAHRLERTKRWRERKIQREKNLPLPALPRQRKPCADTDVDSDDCPVIK